MFIAAIVASAAFACPSGTVCSHDTQAAACTPAAAVAHACGHGADCGACMEPPVAQNPVLPTSSPSVCSHGADCGACMEPPTAEARVLSTAFVGPVVHAVNAAPCGHAGCRELPGGFVACMPYDGRPLTLTPRNGQMEHHYRAMVAQWRANGNAAGGSPGNSGRNDDRIPEFSTRPTATSTLYLDLDGHRETYAGWVQSFGVINQPPFDLDGNPNEINDFEEEVIVDIILHLFEELAPYNVNITTVEPDPTADNYVPAVRLSIGGAGDWVQGAAGIALLNSYMFHVVPALGMPTAFAFPDLFSSGDPGFAETISMIVAHEWGHTVGLRHQSLEVAEGLFLEYHPGFEDWGPLMGAPYNSAHTTWHNGPARTLGGFPQLDIDVFTGDPFFIEEIEDDHADNTIQASPVEYPDGNREPFIASGIISSTAERDVFRFRTQDGTLRIRGFGGFPSQNLDLKISVASGGRVATLDNPESLNIFGEVRNLEEGTHYLIVESAGSYGWIGQYVIEGTFIPGPTVVDACRADLNGDGVIDLADLVGAFGNFGNSGTGDLDNDGKVDLKDILTILASFGTDCPVEDDEL